MRFSIALDIFSGRLYSSYTLLDYLSTTVLFVCLFVWRFSPHSKNFHSFVDVIMTGEWPQILIYAPHLWPLKSEGSLTATPTLTWGILLWYSPRTRAITPICREVGS